MEDMASSWSYQEDMDELKKQLIYLSLELEKVTAVADQEVRKWADSFNQLIQLLEIARQERDEARDELEKLKIAFMSATPTDFSATALQPQQLLQANSSITESNSLSETYNYSAVEPFLGGVSAPDISSLNMNPVDSSVVNPFLNPHPFSQDYNNLTLPIDQRGLAIQNIAEGRTLPQIGNFVKAMEEARPPFKSLLVVGPLPKWRNPPPLNASFPMPPPSLKSFNAAEIFVPTSALSSSMGEGSGSFPGSGMLISADANTYGFNSIGKRQMFQ